jgi:hypothetical protein
MPRWRRDLREEAPQPADREGCRVGEGDRPPLLGLPSWSPCCLFAYLEHPGQASQMQRWKGEMSSV